MRTAVSDIVPGTKIVPSGPSAIGVPSRKKSYVTPGPPRAEAVILTVPKSAKQKVIFFDPKIYCSPILEEVQGEHEVCIVNVDPGVVAVISIFAAAAAPDAIADSIDA